MKRGRSPTLRGSLSYDPVELSFGTSGLRGLVTDITDLEAYVAVRGFLTWLADTGDAEPGSAVCLGGDLRPSTEDILRAACRAVQDAGFVPLHFGTLPTPALLLAAMKRGAPGVMVTGSHIPFDRNGIKLTKKEGEVLKPDEEPIRNAVRAAREAEYSRPLSRSMFDESGRLRPDFRVPLPPASDEAAREYCARYTSAFPRGALRGIRILVYQHSSVCRDILAQVLEELGAAVVAAGRSDTFVAVDTEAVSAEMVQAIQALVDANGGSSLDAVASTDGDGDRPLLLGVDKGRVRFFPGDVLGIVTADFLGAREIAVPVSVNDAVDIHFASRGVRPVKTRIGSPWVISALREVGWEANGGFLTAAPVRVPGGAAMEALPTRDALLPILSALYAGPGSGMTLGALFSRLPPRHGSSALLRPFPREQGQALVEAFSPSDTSVVEARREPGSAARWRLRRGDGTETWCAETDPLHEEICSLRDSLEACFTPVDGFAPVLWINWLDGVRVGFENKDIAHVRPSGNAPELRIYAAADTEERAQAIARLGVAPGGLLERLAREAEARRAAAAFRSSPEPLRLEGAVQTYAWGGREFIPRLLGRENPGRVPHAELWIGAHPRAPARVLIRDASVGLDRLVALAGREVLGKEDCARFGGKLPYLLKVLDARTMLSIQAHPDRKQAAEGFARENAAGIPLDAPERTYRDDNHKPEVHACLTEFWMLHGFRPLEEIAAVLEQTPGLARILPEFGRRLRAAGGSAQERSSLLRDLYTRVMTMPQAEVNQILGPLISGLQDQEQRAGLDKDSPGFWALRAARGLPLPGGALDRGIFSIYLMNLLHLHPGQGTWQAAGVLHAYLEGTNVELMANSDNVLRGGLTPKNVDLTELLRIVSFTDGHPQVLTGRTTVEGVSTYETPAEEFVLDRIELEKGRSLKGDNAHGAECFIAIEGSATMRSGRASLALDKGAALLAPAGVPYSLHGQAARTLIFRARIPQLRRATGAS